MIYFGFALILGALLGLLYYVDEEKELPGINPILSTAFLAGFLIAWFLAVIRLRIIPCYLTAVFAVGVLLVYLGM